MSNSLFVIRLTVAKRRRAKDSALELKRVLGIWDWAVVIKGIAHGGNG
jgi:hypothetical protein